MLGRRKSKMFGTLHEEPQVDFCLHGSGSGFESSEYVGLPNAYPSLGFPGLTKIKALWMKST